MGDFGGKTLVPDPLVFNAPLRGLPLEFCNALWNEEIRMMDLLNGKNDYDYDAYNRIDAIPALDRRTDRQTERNGKSGSRVSVLMLDKTTF